MRYDEQYNPKPQSMQTQLHGLGMDGEQDVAEAVAWIEENPEAYAFMLKNARRLHAQGYVSASYLVNMARNELHVKVKNGHAPVLARIISKTEPDLRGAFHTHSSKSDEFV